MLVLPSGYKDSTWEDSPDGLARYHFLQADDVSQVAINRNDDPDLFTTEELEIAVESLQHSKTYDHDGIVIRFSSSTLSGYWPCTMIA